MNKMEVKQKGGEWNIAFPRSVQIYRGLCAVKRAPTEKFLSRNGQTSFASFPPPLLLDVRELNVFWLELRRSRPCCTKSSYDSPVKRSFVARNCSRRTFSNFPKLCLCETRQLVYGNEPSFHSLAPTHRLATRCLPIVPQVSLSLSFFLSSTLHRILSLSSLRICLLSLSLSSSRYYSLLPRENYEQLDEIHRSIVLEASATIKGIECSPFCVLTTRGMKVGESQQES